MVAARLIEIYHGGTRLTKEEKGRRTIMAVEEGALEVCH
jgi:hypothetical protein